ncbi:M81 family metallopeptidase [Actinoplanes sp. NBRC 103695]|uniref:M81 family metallopeptidase n=1 Tax=Actinoplanes sp. NBRC 103695 TaxID=3032202 RepID=UPI0024A218CF|nr:M81 family metallopeptidase [Actinoplanes sp. NBRC 103695]GLY93771.1 microcystin degradation protein MlrC [Actinoplanes sp. NBRC 103695]
MRVAIGGIHIESSTFSPHISTTFDFDVTRDKELLARYDWLDQPWAEGVEWVPLVHARALPGGAVDPEAYRAWESEMVEKLAAAGPVDGMLLDFHGAMSVVGRDDAEGDLVTAIRAAIGPAPLISTAMDLHGNVSRVLFDACDLLTCYRTAPHVDVWETRERAARNLTDALRRAATSTSTGAASTSTGAASVRPHKALVHVPILLPGEQTSTRDEPARGLYARIPEIEARPGIIDAAVWIGFAWADQPRCRGAVVVTGHDATAVATAARELGDHFWAAREKFAFVAPTGTMDECLDAAVASSAPGPFFISDSGDNPGAGGADDVTYALSRMLARPDVLARRSVFASLVDPQAVAEVADHPIGSRVRVTAGGRIDGRDPGPLDLDGTLEAVADDPAGGRCVSVRIEGLSVFVTSRRMQYRLLDSYRRLGVDVASAGIVTVKIGYLEPELFEAAGNWMLALTPGGVDQHLARLPYTKVERPFFPLDRDFDADLTVVTG